MHFERLIGLPECMIKNSQSVSAVRPKGKELRVKMD